MIDAAAQLRRDPLGFLAAVQAEGGDFCRFKVGAQPVLFVSDPAAIRSLLGRLDRGFVKQNVIATTGDRVRPPETEGLMSSDDHDRHLSGRRLVSPAFAASRSSELAAAAGRHAHATFAGWRADAPVDVLRTVSETTIAIVGDAVFGVPLAERAAALSAYVDEFLDGFRLVTSPAAAMGELLRPARRRRFARANAALLGLADELSGSGSCERNVAVLLEAAQAAGRIDPQRRRRDTFTIFLAAVETTAAAVTWTWLLLALHPRDAEWVAAEADAVLGSADAYGEPASGAANATADTISRLSRARAVFAEALRLYPPSWFIARRSLRDQELAGHEVAAGTVVLVCPYLVHRDPRAFDRPDEFVPSRWEAPTHPSAAYLPFGAGPRQCLGERLAWIEGTLLTALAAKGWLLEHDGPYRMQAGASLRPAERVLLRVRPRDGPVQASASGCV